jgi:hypothetical protein
MFFNLCASVILISIWGAYGAVLANLLTEALIMAYQLYTLSQIGQTVSLSKTGMKLLLSVAIMALAVYLTSSFGLLLAILSGLVIYPLALCVFQAFADDEIEVFRHMWTVGRTALSERFKQRPVIF